MTKHAGRSPIRVAGATLAALALLALAGCSGSGNDSESSGDSAMPVAGSAPADASAPGKGSVDEASGGGAGTGRDIDPISLQTAALIKTGSIELESDGVGGVIDKIRGLVLTSGGRISSEDTSTNRDGEEVRSRIELQVPVAKFEDAFNEIPSFATLIDKKSSEEDVTGQLADVNSRVKSQEDSIDQLRLLFGQATKLRDIIALERELSQRQADLEALQAQQRSLNAQTTMSTILVSIRTPAAVAAEQADEDQAGFVAGIKDGWNGMVTFVVGTSHALGLILPLGSLIVVAGAAVWLLVRRFSGRQEPPVQPQPSE
jgi:hypothetical protein